MSRNIVIDIETDAIKATTIWCVACQEINNIGTQTEDILLFTDRASLVKYLKEDYTLIAHNGIDFDFPILRKLWSIPITNVKDTLIMSRLFNPDREGGHSLSNWGKILGYNKIEYNHFSSYTDSMAEYCKRDVEITTKLYYYLLQEGKEFSSKSILLEHNIADIIHRQKTHGFFLDKSKAISLFTETNKKLKE